MLAPPHIPADLAKLDAFFPILPTLGNRWAQSRPWEGITVGLHLHLTTLTLALVRELVLGGGTWVVSAANPATTDMGVVTYLRSLGVEVHSGGGVKDGVEATVAAGPLLFADVGFALAEALLQSNILPRAGVEITRSGITRLRAAGPLPFPIMNINDGQLKPAIENRRGVGEGLWPGFTALTGMHLSGRRVAVLGYGPVGAGVASFARAAGASVEVVETDAPRRLIAHYDGFPTPAADAALARAQIVVTATGVRHTLSALAMCHIHDGAVLLSAGHGGDEIATDWLRTEAESIDNVGPRVVRYRLGDGRHLTVLADGNPLNIVLNSGSPEPVLLHFAILGLALEWLARNAAAPGELPLPAEIETDAAAIALATLGVG